MEFSSGSIQREYKLTTESVTSKPPKGKHWRNRRGSQHWVPNSEHPRIEPAHDIEPLLAIDLLSFETVAPCKGLITFYSSSL